MSNLRKKIERSGRTLAAGFEQRRLPRSLTSRWVVAEPGDDAAWEERMQSFRRTVIPWMNDVAPLDGQKILEVGMGTGASTTALVEQGGEVTGIDLEQDHLDTAHRNLTRFGLRARLVQGNAAALADVAAVGEFEQIVFWAVLEHMTISERIEALQAAWQCLSVDGLLTLVETPNRLWPYDAHTSLLPFFSWLPHELGYLASTSSPRPGFGDRYEAERMEQDMGHFLRRGHGVSFHEFDVAIGDHRLLDVVSYMQGYWRDRNPARSAGWRLSQAGKTERMLGSYVDGIHPAWLQPYLFLTIRKGGS